MTVWNVLRVGRCSRRLGEPSGSGFFHEIMIAFTCNILAGAAVVVNRK